ncbi:MAG: hypothetical protein JWR61_4637 [Ferruginibacter sp.]|nr:hypothetical protein [Ferruginibacter sp.]
MKTVNKLKAIGISFLAFFLLMQVKLNAQVGIGTASPNTSAQLDVTSSNKGFLPPRMTQTERDAIVSPAPGLMIWCSNCGAYGEIQTYNGTTWTNMIGGSASQISVVIGAQEWMIRNLDIATYRNGDTIPQVKDPSEWYALMTGAWCYYNNDPTNGHIYGKLYNWYAVADPRGLATAGWHIASDAEWYELEAFLGGVNDVQLVAGDKVKEIGTSHWKAPNKGATNSSGFTALPGGARYQEGAFNGIGEGGNFWTSSESGYYANFWTLSNMNSYIDHLNVGSKYSGMSVRCVKDIAPMPSAIIGTQEWMKTNLNVSAYNNGDPIPQVQDPTVWDTLTTGAYCYYDYNYVNSVYGKLYNWYAVHDPRGVAPAGWHVATDAEWSNLTSDLGGESVAGNKIKETGTYHWHRPNAGATNESYFTALPGGKREEGVFKQLGTVGSWWTGTEDTVNTSVAWYREVNFYDPNIYRWAIKKQTGFSVRCVKD